MGRWALAAMVLAAGLAACGGGGGSDTAARAAPAEDAACVGTDDSLLFAYQMFLQPYSSSNEGLVGTLRSETQFGQDEDVTLFFETLVASSGSFNPVWSSFSSAQFGSIVNSPATFEVDEVDYVGATGAVLVFTVEQESVGLPASPHTVAQVAGRLVCVDEGWRVTLADLCEILGAGPGPSCPPEIETKGEEGLTRALTDADLPEVSPPTFETVPTTAPPAPTIITSPGPGFPVPGSDGVCPYVGEPCSANVTNDPDCICSTVPGGPGFAQDGPGTLVCRGTPRFG